MNFSRFGLSAPAVRAALIAVALYGCASAPPAGTAASAQGESAFDSKIEAALPAIEAARRRGQARESLTSYADRTDREGKLLAAWSNPDRQAAWNAFHGLERFDAPDAWAELGMARVYLDWKTSDQAKAALARALAIDPGLAEAYVLRAELDRVEGRLADSEADDQRALALRPMDAFALDGLGTVARQQGRTADARRRFDEAQRGWPDDFVALRGLADLDLAAGDAPAALRSLDELHRLAPDDTALWLESGRLREKQGDLAGATKDFEAAQKRGANAPDLLGLLADSYRKEGRKDDERRVLTELVAQGGDAKALRRLAELELAAGDAAAALRDDQKAVAKDPKDIEAQLALARLEAQQGALSDAIGAYRSLVPARPDLKAELAPLEREALLAQKPLGGSVAKINGALGYQLDRLYRSLLAKKPGLQGELKMRVTVEKDGHVSGEEFVTDTVGSPALAANLFWNAHDAHFPPTPAKYVFKFNLRP